MPVVNPGGAQPPPGYHPPQPPDYGDPFGTPGHGGVRNPGGIPWLDRFDTHPVRFLQNHPGKVAAIQRMIRNTGYHINVDGQMGPQTRAAARAYVRDPTGFKQWNRNNIHSNSYQVTHTDPASDTTHPRDRTRNPPGDKLPKVPKVPKGALGLGGKMINPVRLAKAETRYGYGGIIRGFQGQISDQTLQAAQNRADLAHYYDQIKASAGTAAANDAANALAQQQAADKFRMGVINAVGGGASAAGAGVASFADITSGGQRDLATNQAAFDQNMQAQLVSQAASAQTQQQRLDANKLAAIQGQLDSARKARADAYVVNLQNAYGMSLQERAANAAAIQAGYGLQLQAKVTRSDLATAAVGRDAARKAARKAGVTGTGLGVLKDPGQSQALSKAIDQALDNSATRANGQRLTPRDAWKVASTYLYSTTKHVPGQNQRVFNWIKNYYAGYVTDYVHWWNNAHKGQPQKTPAMYMNDSGTPWPASHWTHVH